MIHNRFRSDPPLKEQLELCVENSRPIAKVAEDLGITLAMENHLDYRASEIVQIIEGVGSSNLRFLFDMGNTVVVIEDPVEAAKVAAPYTVLCHLKDVRILPWTPSALYVAAIFAAPLGRGNVDILQILRDPPGEGSGSEEPLPLAREHADPAERGRGPLDRREHQVGEGTPREVPQLAP